MLDEKGIGLVNLLYLFITAIMLLCTYPSREEIGNAKIYATYTPEERFSNTCLLMAFLGAIVVAYSVYALISIRGFDFWHWLWPFGG